MKKSALAVMAAGIGSRFGKGIKQLEPLGPSGEIMIDYSVYDALSAGFDQIIFIIRKDIEEAFRERIGRRVEKIADVAYAFQDPDDLPGGFARPADRVKPWGTGQAVLAARDIISTPFAVINADDYYGKTAFGTLHDYLVREDSLPEQARDVSMVAFRLGNTLSEHGGVTRGICRLDESGNLAGISETKNIIRDGAGAAILTDGGTVPVDPATPVSMHMWGLQPAVVQLLEVGFRDFVGNLKEGDLKSDYLLPIFIDELLQKDQVQVKVLESAETWFGVTYQEDKEAVKAAFRKLIAGGVYPADLYDA